MFSAWCILNVSGWSVWLIGVIKYRKGQMESYSDVPKAKIVAGWLYIHFGALRIWWHPAFINVEPIMEMQRGNCRSGLSCCVCVSLLLKYANNVEHLNFSSTTLNTLQISFHIVWVCFFFKQIFYTSLKKNMNLDLIF